VLVDGKLGERWEMEDCEVGTNVKYEKEPKIPGRQVDGSHCEDT